MGLKRPPRHTVDGAPIYVLRADEAWDETRIADELAAARKVNERLRIEAEQAGEEVDQSKLIDLDDHPVTLYTDGRNRFQLDAPIEWMGQETTAEAYIKDKRGAWRFELRIFSHEEWAEVFSTLGRDRAAAWPLACRIGIKACVGRDAPKLECVGGRLDFESMERLHELNPMLSFDLGKAAWDVSQPLTVEEKKR